MQSINSPGSFKIHFLAFPKRRGEEERAFIKYSLMGETIIGDGTKPQGGKWHRERDRGVVCSAGRCALGPSRQVGGCAHLKGSQAQPLPLCPSAQLEARTRQSGSRTE